MYNPQPVNSSGSPKRGANRFAGTWMPGNGRGKSGVRKKNAVKERQRSWRLKRMSRKIFFILMTPVLLICLGWLVFTVLVDSDIFRITEVSVQGNQVTTRQQILSLAGMKHGTNLLTLDVAHIENLIREEQWVDEVWVKRQWPSTVEIIIREYKPFALINLERDGTGQLYYMDNKGVVFAPSAGDRDLDYPVMNGPRIADDLQGKKFKENSLSDMALDFLKLTSRGNQILPTQAVSEIHVDPEKGLVVYLVDHPFPIYMGSEKIKLRFSRLVRVLAKLYKDKKIEGISEIRMDYADNKILVARVE